MFPNIKSLVAKSLYKTWINSSNRYPNKVNLLTGEHFVAYSSPVDDAYLNWVWIENITPKLIKQIDDFYQNTPHCYFIDTSNKNLLQQINETNLIATNKFRQFYKNLSVDEDYTSDNKHNLKIHLAKSPDEVDLWCKTFCKGYGAYSSEYIKEDIRHFVEFDDFCLATGTYQGKPVTTGMLYTNGDTAGIFGISTIISHRNKGFAKQMSDFLSLVAKQKNCTKIALNSTPEADPMYFKLGYAPLLEEVIYIADKYFF